MRGYEKHQRYLLGLPPLQWRACALFGSLVANVSFVLVPAHAMLLGLVAWVSSLIITGTTGALVDWRLSYDGNFRGPDAVARQSTQERALPPVNSSTRTDDLAPTAPEAHLSSRPYDPTPFMPSLRQPPAFVSSTKSVLPGADTRDKTDSQQQPG